MDMDSNMVIAEGMSRGGDGRGFGGTNGNEKINKNKIKHLNKKQNVKRI